MEIEELDDAVLELLMKAKRHPDLGTRLLCVGTVNGAPCDDQLYRCRACGAVGCRTEGCTRYVYDRGNGCTRCGVGAGMNRNVKITAVELMQLWEKLHPGQ